MSSYSYKIIEKHDKSFNFKAIFNGNTGFYIRTGILKDGKDTGVDPFMSSFPELIDVGIMGQCKCANRCNVDCYQNAINRHEPNMSLDDFKRIVDECRGKTFEFALGGAGDPDTHENFAEILRYCAINDIVPNFTTSGILLNSDSIRLCKEYCGAVAVSDHNAEYTKKAVNNLINAGVKTNIHYVLNKDTIRNAINILYGKKECYPGLNAVVFLLYKPVGLGKADKVLTPENEDVIEFFEAVANRQVDFKIGFDSCSCTGLLNYCKTYDARYIDFCEGARFSMYISADMKAMPCSFANQNSEWWYDIKDKSVNDAWHSDVFNKFRQHLQFSCPNCKDRNCCAGGCPLMESISLCRREEKVGYDICDRGHTRVRI